VTLLGAAATLAAGCVLWLAFPPEGLWPLAPVGALLFLFALQRARSYAAAAALSLLAKAVCAALLSLRYLYGVWPPVWLLYAANYGLIWAAFGAVFHGVRRHKGEVAALAAAPFLWVLFDRFSPAAHFLPSDIPTLAVALGDSPLLGLAPWLGIYGLSFLPVAAACAFLLLLRARAPGERRAALAGAGLLAFVSAVVPALVSLGASDAGGAERTLAFAAAHLREDGKDAAWAAAEKSLLEPRTRSAFADYAEGRLREAAAGLAPGKARLIILPEDAVDLSFERDRSREAYARWGLEDNGALIEAYRAFARRTGAALSVGLTTLRGGRVRNTLMLIGRDGDVAGLSDKHRLAAGSERWPLGFLRYWKLFPRGPGTRFVSYDEQYVPGDDPSRMLSFEGLPFGAPMCLEGHSPTMALAWKRRAAQFLLFTSNAQWFDADPATYNRQVLSLVRLQAGAYALPVLMTGKQSYLGWVDDRGRPFVEPGFGRGPRAQTVFLEARIHPGRQTAVSRRGEYFVPLSLLVLSAVPFLFRRKERRSA
jgi:apolipoprotein N-acyltransferase